MEHRAKFNLLILFTWQQIVKEEDIESANLGEWSIFSE